MRKVPSSLPLPSLSLSLSLLPSHSPLLLHYSLPTHLSFLPSFSLAGIRHVISQCNVNDINFLLTNKYLLFLFFFLREERGVEEERGGVGEEAEEEKGRRGEKGRVKACAGMVDGCERGSWSPLLFALSSHLIH